MSLNLILPTENCVLGHCSETKGKPIYFRNLKEGMLFHYYIDTPNWIKKDNIKPTCGINICTIQSTIHADGTSEWHHVNSVSRDVVFKLLVNYFEEKIWPQFQKSPEFKDVSKVNAFGNTVIGLFPQMIKGWNIERWMTNVEEIIKKGLIMQPLTDEDMKRIVQKVKEELMVQA